uniref:histidine kinase n=1 Tax=Desulfatirhabdium butyrativorans TaxID=340467 RepID=A0A7C4RSH1_9BACT
MMDATTQLQQLREKAEALIDKRKLTPEDVSEEALSKVWHELKVHQIELELQNEELRKAQQTLSISRDRFAMLFHQAPVGYLVLNPNGLILEVNETFCRMIGAESDTILSRGLNDFLIDEDKGTFLARYRAFYQNPAEKSMELGIHAAGDTIRYVRLSGARMQQPSGNSTEKRLQEGLLVTLIDITDLVLAQKTLNAHLDHVQAMLEILQHPMDNLKDFLERVLETGLSVTESRYGILMHVWDGTRFMVSTWSQEVSRDCQVRDAQASVDLHNLDIVRESLQTRQPVVYNDTNHFGKRPAHFPPGHLPLQRLLCYPIFQNETPLAMLLLADKPSAYLPGDILQLKLIVDVAIKTMDREVFLTLLKEREQNYRTLTENSQDCIMRFDEKGRHLFVNSAALRMTRLRLEDFLGKTHREMGFPPDLCDFWESTIQEVFTKKCMQEREFSWDGPDGQIVFDWRLFPEMDERGNILSVVSVARDITKWRQAQAERDRMQLEMLKKQKMESVGRLAGGIAHDFNNKLQAILGYTDMAIEDATGNAQVVADLQSIKDISMNLADLVRQLLGYASKQMVSPRILDLNETITGMMGMLRRLIGEHIRLDWKTTPDLWPVNIDPGQIDQILMHLCLNARDAIRSDGTIRIRVNNVTLGPADCFGHPDRAPGEYVKLCVSDTGVGIDPVILEHVFEPFFTNKDIDKGKGLGLAVIYGIVRQNGGFVEVESRMQEGTTFRIFLPRCPAPAKPTKLSDVRAIRKATILLVEDDPNILDIGKKILERMGYEALIAQGAEEALALAETVSIDLLITDVIMPDMNGKVLSEQLGRKFPEMRTVFMSGHTADIIAPHGILDQDTHFLQKPFTVHAFMEMVQKALGEKTR